MFSSFRKKPKKSESTDGTPLRASPSLPELSSQGVMPWPESLVDVESIQKEQPDPTTLERRPTMATKTSFSAVDRNADPIPFHKPFRPHDGPISALYMGSPGGKNGVDVARGSPISAHRYQSQRRARLPPNTFNLMVVGGQGTGKTSFLRLLLDTAELSSRATLDQKAALDSFLRGSTKRTKAITTACVEISEARHEHLLFSVIDTPGLDFTEGRELKLERQVSSIIKYIDSQYADTLNEEAKVVRTSKGDQHIHLCVYMIDPRLIMTARARRDISSLPSQTRSEVTISLRKSEAQADASDESDDESDSLTMSPAELRAIRRLSTRCNVLPIIAHADSLTDDKLNAVKEAVRQSMAESGLDFGVFGSPIRKNPKNTTVPPTPQTPTQSPTAEKPKSPRVKINGHGGKENGATNHASGSEEEESGEEERQSRPVIKLRPARHPSARNLSRSRSRRDLSTLRDELDDGPVYPDPHNRDSVANVRFSAHVIGRKDVASMMPFAFIAPESGRRNRPIVSTNASDNDVGGGMSRPGSVAPSEDGHANSTVSTPTTADLEFTKRAPPEPLRGVYVRNYRWGQVDVLNPDHCDFSALRTSIMSTSLKMLKVNTREVLYERYRTEKLLARRATRQITEEERSRLLEDLGL